MYTRNSADDLQSEQEDFDGPIVYARTKRAEVVLTEMWAQQLAGTGVSVHAMHPGWADTAGVRSSSPASTVRRDRSCAARIRAPTRSSGLAPPPSPPTARAGSGTTADADPPTSCPELGNPTPSDAACGPLARP